jgi:hypothetical protein
MTNSTSREDASGILQMTKFFNLRRAAPLQHTGPKRISAGSDVEILCTPENPDEVRGQQRR